MSITINGTTGIAGVDGSATTPAFQGNDTNTGLFYGTDIVGISTGGSERVRVDASGNVGIGTASPSYKLDVVGGINASGNVSTSSGNFVLGTNDTYLGFASNNIKFNNTSDRITLTTGASERMRIDSSGNVLVGKTATDLATAGAEIRAAGYGMFTVSGDYAVYARRNTSTGQVIAIRYAGTDTGSISTNGTNTAYATSSDYRLKENIVPMIGALDKVLQLKPVTYTWKANGTNSEGFIAHELAEVCPQAVIGEKDAVDENGEIKPQGIDTSYLVATLTKAIQEQQELIKQLQLDVSALKEANNV